MSLQRMIVMQPDTFERWKKFIIDDKNLSDLDREMKKVLYNNKINALSKWHLYRQNLLKYLNVKHKMNNIGNKSKYSDVSTQTFSPDKTSIGTQAIPDNTEDNLMINAVTQTKLKKKDHRKTQTIPDNRSVGTQARIMRKAKEIPSIDEVFGDSSRFSNLDDESDNITTDGDRDQIELDVDNIIRHKALEGQPLSVKILKERQSLDPNEYRLFELNTGETVNVPVERQIVTRATLKRRANSDSSQTKLNFPQRKEKVKSTSTPKKTHQKGGIAWKSYK